MSQEISSSVGRAIITYSRSWQALSIIRSLGSRGIDVIAGDEEKLNRFTPGNLSKYARATFEYPSFNDDEQAFVDALLQVIKDHAPSRNIPYVLIPVHRETRIIAQYADRFLPLIRVPLAEADKFEQVDNKIRFWELAKRAKVMVPPSWFPKNIAELEKLLPEISMPVFVKSTKGAAGVGVLRATSREETLDAYEELSSQAEGADSFLMIQKEIQGEDYCTSALCDRGKVLTAMTYRNVLSFPPDSGPGAVRETVIAPSLVAATERIVESIEWHGVAQVDFRWTGNEREAPVALELNPRFWSGLFQAIQSGVDFPWLLFKLAIGERVDEFIHVKTGVRTEMPIVGMLATMADLVEQKHPGMLQEAWQRSGRQMLEGKTQEAIATLLNGLATSFSLPESFARFKGIIEGNKDNISVLVDKDDPLPSLGLLYPLLIFLRHGKDTLDVLAGMK